MAPDISLLWSAPPQILGLHACVQDSRVSLWRLNNDGDMDWNSAVSSTAHTLLCCLKA